ncbi:unnamed protein product [Mesocestoides corti]|nr:unnamed protein product [Mesocestoides corti]
MNSTQLTGLDALQQKQIGGAGPDARRMRKAIFRRTIDYNASVINYLKERVWKRSPRSRLALQPDYLYNYLMNPPSDYLDNPMNCVTGKLVRTSTNKNKCPIYCVCWTPEGRRLITGAFSGEFTLWNGLTFNFETILQAHEAQIRCMKWSHNDEWLLTADHAGYVKYWQANMNNVQMYQAHKMPIRGVSFSQFDSKFVTCSDDATVRIWDFFRCYEERALRGHGSDVRSVAWHPYKSLIISGSKDAQQPIKLWEPKTGESVATLYVHKNTCTDVAWNKNGNWFLTASRDHLIKLFDLRYMKTELQTFRGHKKDVMRVAWHPCHECLFASGSADGAIHFWCTGTETELGAIDDAHESMIWSLAWHPLGHILVSGANDFATKFWTRNRPGDILKDIIGTGNAVASTGIANVLPALNTEDLASVTLSKVASTTNANINGVGGSLARALADAAGRLPIFESDDQSNVLDLGNKEVAVEIPGLNDGPPGPLVSEDEHESDATKSKPLPNRPAGSISKEFMANWSSSRAVPKPGVVLSAVAAAKESTRESSGVGGMNPPIPGESLEEGEIEDDPTLLRSVSTPLVTSDMCMNPKAKAAASEAAEYDTRYKGRKFDSAAREEEMLAFANSLMPPSPPHKSPQEPPPPMRSNAPPPNQQPSSRFGPPPPPPPPPKRYMPGPPSRYPHSGYPPPGQGGPPYWRQPMPFRPPHDQWGGPGPYNGPPPPPGYGGPPPPKRPAVPRPPPPPMRRGW